jgi:hypothetical protein
MEEKLKDGIKKSRKIIMKKDGKTVFLFLPAAKGCLAAVCARSAGVPSVPGLPSIFIDTY